MRQPELRGALAFAIPVLLVFAVSAAHAAATGQAQSYYFLAAGPLCGIAGGLAYGRRLGLPIVLGLCFGLVGLMFSLQDGPHSPLFSDVVWTGFVSGFLFWLAGGCAMLTLPAQQRFDGAAALAVPGAIAGMAFQFFYGPARFLFDLGSRKWWGNSPWEHLILWLIVAIGGGWLLGKEFGRRQAPEEEAIKAESRNAWGLAAVVCGLLGLGIGVLTFLRTSLPLGLFNSLSPISAASDWLWGWGLLATGIGVIAVAKPRGRKWAVAGLGLAAILLVASFRVEANPWKTRFNSNYASKLIREHGDSGDAIYAGNLILAQAALDTNDLAGAKRYLLAAAASPGSKAIEEKGLDTAVARVLLQKGEKDTVLEYLHRGRTLWPKGAQAITRWENAIKAGRQPNFNQRGNPQQDRQQQLDG
jgi:hypothetical protein